MPDPNNGMEATPSDAGAVFGCSGSQVDTLQALEMLHMPQSAEEDLEPALQRLSFDELLVIQIQLLLRRSFIRCFWHH